MSITFIMRSAEREKGGGQLFVRRVGARTDTRAKLEEPKGGGVGQRCTDHNWPKQNTRTNMINIIHCIQIDTIFDGMIE